ncbi:MAG: U32 family peptidase [Ruminococcaceae bacterium]|nr:U32 family peptidase [Oscillospiraceae bacterium]
MTERKKLPELLAPAGSLDALKAAIDGGADAIYVGGSSFNARINAKNFTAEELREGAKLAHAYGAKLYVTTNTLIHDIERTAFLKAAEEAYLCGADALIIADVGAARLVSERIPIELHASTQFSGHNADAARFLAENGFSRMVCAREMSETELRRFVAESPIEAEVFVHGALCVCHSGQCLFSSIVGGRSGNRGECAQPCRLPYRTSKGKTDYPLSLKDLSLARHIPKLIDMGVASLKIEGRMKSPEYVRDVTRIWRRLLDEGRGADDRDMQELSQIFSRGGFTDGYFTERIDGKMLGIRSDTDKERTRSLEAFTGITKKMPIEILATVKKGEPMSLTEKTSNITVLGEAPMDAINAPIDAETVKRSLSKWGNTPYVPKSVEVEIDSGVMTPISSLNALRRALCDELLKDLSDMRSISDIKKETLPSYKKEKPTQSRSAVFYRAENILSEAREYFDIIYLPIHEYNGQTNGVMLPAVIYDGEMERIEKMLQRAKAMGAEHILVGNYGHLLLARNSGFHIHGDLRLNVTNETSAAVCMENGFEDMILSPELTLAQMRDIKGRSFAVVYGRLPLMVTEKCIGKEISDCNTCKRGRAELVDRKGARFPVFNDGAHRSLIFNSVPIYMADKMRDVESKGIIMHHYIFTVETPNEVRAIINAYKKGTPPSVPVRRIK